MLPFDEKAYHFGGTPCQHVTPPTNITSYPNCAPTRFKLEQWAATCGDDCCVKKSWTVWVLRDQTSEELQKQLDECNAETKKITEDQRANSRIHDTFKHQCITYPGEDQTSVAWDSAARHCVYGPCR